MSLGLHANFMIMEQTILYNEHADRDIHNKYVNLMSNAGFKAFFADENKRDL